MARPEFDIAVIGGGSGGLVVAAGGAALGARVALVEKHKLGGDCLWYGCVPSKTLIKSARIAHEMRHADRWALQPHEPHPDLARVMERVAGVIRSIEPNDSPERFRGLGVDVTFGEGRFTAADTFEVGGRSIRARDFVIATGSRPAVPAIPGLDTAGYLTNETLFDLREPVPHLIVVGSGPIGSEMAQAFRRLGSAVTVIDVATSLLPREDADMAAVVHRRMLAEGVDYHLGASIARVERVQAGVRLLVREADGTPHTLEGTHLLLAAGRLANIEGLGLDAAGVDVAHGRIVLENGICTSNPHVYVAGDVAGGHQFTHLAEHHAGVVLRHVIFKLRWTRPSPVLPWCTFTDPELARVGMSESDAKKSGAAYRVYTFPFADIDRARAEGETEGMAKLVTATNGRLLGATIVGPHAGELIAECVLAIEHRMKASALSAAIHAYPTLSQINRRAADMRQKEALTPRARSWLRRIFRLQGA